MRLITFIFLYGIMQVLTAVSVLADYSSGDTVSFKVDLLTASDSLNYNSADSNTFGVNLLNVRRSFADSDGFGVLTNEPVYIITHGYQFLGEFTDWALPMAQAIRIRSGGGKVMKYNKETGIFDVQQPSDEFGVKVLVFDWATESDQDCLGHSEAAGDALFAALIMGQRRGDFKLENLHFIGHSRGCVVNSEAAERIIAIGYTIEQMTTLDGVDGGLAGIICTDYDVNPTLGDVGFVSWKGIKWVDNYYSYNDCQEVLLLDGRYLSGAYNEDVTSRGQCPILLYLRSAIDHLNIFTWYHGTIDLTAGSVGSSTIFNSEWYGGLYRERDEAGFNQSIIVGKSRPAISGSQTSIAFSFATDALINGDFSRAPALPYLTLPGWSSHGGGGTGLFPYNRLELDKDHHWRRHNRFYVPENALILAFSYSIITESQTGDCLAVFIGPENEGNLLGTVALDSIREGAINFSIPQNKRGTVQTLTFVIGTPSSITSKVAIDNIGLIVCQNSTREDFNCDYNVDILDLTYLGEYWLENVPLLKEADLSGDAFVNFDDFVKFAQKWFVAVN